jgi:hypothetical protein
MERDTMSTTCPVCYAKQDQGLLCDTCTVTFITDLRGNRVVMGVAELVDNLHIAQAKQSRLTDQSGKGGVKHERSSMDFGAMEAVRNLEFYLGSWARDLTGDKWRPRGPVRAVRRAQSPPGPFCPTCRHDSCANRRVYEFAPVRYIAVQAAGVLIDRMDEIRRHGAVKELVEEITKAIDRARDGVDVEPFTRFCVGPCPEECDRTVFAVCPAEGSQRPALMACYVMRQGENRPDLGAGFLHSWTSVQFYRAGERIRRKMEAQRKAAA